MTAMDDDSAPTLRQMLPEVLAPLLPPFFEVRPPIERKATCATCAMCPPVDAPLAQGALYFRPDAKCCTYHPILPNYLVGGILSDERPEMALGRSRVLDRMRDRRGVMPSALGPSRKTNVLQTNAGKRAFGQSLVLLCPYFEQKQGLCTVWPYRESTCSTYHCRHVDGADGKAFWHAIHGLVAYIEVKLAFAAANSIIPGYTEAPSEGLTANDLEDRQPPDEEYEARWGDWVGREQLFYERAHAWVRSLEPTDLTRILASPRYDELAIAATEARDALASTTLPERLVPNAKMTWQPVPEGGFRLSTYNAYDSIHGTDALLKAFLAFNSEETVSEVRARLARDEGMQLPEAVILSLYRYRVLVPPSDPTPGRKPTTST